MKKLLLFSILVSLLGTHHFAAISVTSPEANEVIKSAEDFASASFQDPIDMNEQTDLGWFIFDTVSGSKPILQILVFPMVFSPLLPPPRDLKSRYWKPDTQHK